MGLSVKPAHCRQAPQACRPAARLSIRRRRLAGRAALPTLQRMPFTINRDLLRASRRSWFDSSTPRVGPYWLQWVWTLLFCVILAVPFTVLGFMTYASEARGAWRNWTGWIEWYGRNFTVSLTIGVTIHLAFDLLGRAMGGLHRMHKRPKWQRTLFFSGVPLLCTAVAWPVGATLAGAPVLRWTDSTRGQNLIVGAVLLALVLTVVFHQYFAMKGGQIEAEKRAAEAQLRLLQGQIEPHFLFNTLAGVISLVDHEPAKAKRMLQDFTEYLRCSLGALRTGEGPLAQELDLAEHYLRLLGSRMEDRLRWQIDADEAARRVPVPPLLLQPLVENAIHHGLEPQLEGGSVHVSAQVVGRELVLQVQDDGRGLDAPPRAGARRGGGVALANIRSRLQSRYGSSARLELEPANPGTRAVIRLPIDVSLAPGASA